MKNIGPYQLLEELGRGGMGIVYQGYDPAIGRPVAIKVIRAGDDASAVEKASLKLRFAREAAAAGKLSHPNIVTIYQLGEEGDIQYLVMELVDGNPLEKMLSTGRAQDGKTVISILTQVAGALDYAHSEGIVHRDVKPANILIRPDGGVKITDFGIARIASQTVTRTGITLGTPAYMSPEQVVAAKVSGQTDQFSLGVIAYQMLGGRRPFDGDTSHALMYQIVSVEPPPLHAMNPAVPARVSEVVARALAKKPEDRFPSCKEFARRLAESLAAAAYPDQDVIETATMKAAEAPPPRPNRRMLLAAAAIVAALGLASAAWMKWPAKTEPPESATKADNRPPASASIEPTTKADGGPPPSASIARKAAETKVVESPPKAMAETAGHAGAPAVPPRREPQPPRAGASQINPKDGLSYGWIPPGTFQMGCSPGDDECLDDESPAHTVTISKGFWIGRTEVTQEAYERVMGNNPSHFRGPKLPVENVNWNEARSYCFGVGMRLPTEAEWEYAARAGNSGSRYGDLDAIAWYNENSGGRTHEVGQKQANAWGLLDMLGNVWEWVADHFGDYQAGSTTDPQGAATGHALARGGSWFHHSRGPRASFRGQIVPAGPYDYGVGVRCAGGSIGSPAGATEPASGHGAPDSR